MYGHREHDSGIDGMSVTIGNINHFENNNPVDQRGWSIVFMEFNGFLPPAFGNI